MENIGIHKYNKPAKVDISIMKHMVQNKNRTACNADMLDGKIRKKSHKLPTLLISIMI